MFENRGDRGSIPRIGVSLSIIYFSFVSLFFHFFSTLKALLLSTSEVYVKRNLQYARVAGRRRLVLNSIREGGDAVNVIYLHQRVATAIPRTIVKLSY